MGSDENAQRQIRWSDFSYYECLPLFLMCVCVCACACIDGLVVEPDMSAGFCPDHKAAMVLFLDRVYGIEDQNFLLHLLEVGFLPDLRAAASLDTVSVCLLATAACLLSLTHRHFLKTALIHI